MIVRKEIRTETGKCGGRYMEDRPEFDVRIYCNRCGREKLRGTDSLGWYEADGDQVHVCPECIETEEEIRITLLICSNISITAFGQEVPKLE
jgi:hypothetical protein